MAEKRVLILLGYDYVDALDKIISRENIFCFLYEPYQKYFDPESLSKLADKMGENLITSDRANSSIKTIIEEEKINCLVTLGWRKLLDLNDFEQVDLLINVHPALLPEYKGYHPVPFVILNNEKRHGITAHLITQEMDAGEIVLKRSFALNEFSTLQSLQYEVNKMMPFFLEELFDLIIKNKISFGPNDDENTLVRAPRRKPEDSEVKLSETLEDVFKKVKAADADRFPAYFIYNGEKVYICMYRDEFAERQTKFDI